MRRKSERTSVCYSLLRESRHVFDVRLAKEEGFLFGTCEREPATIEKRFG